MRASPVDGRAQVLSLACCAGIWRPRRTADLARKRGVWEATLYNWKAKFGGLDVSEAKPLAAEEATGRADVGCRSVAGAFVKKMVRLAAWNARSLAVEPIARLILGRHRGLRAARPQGGIDAAARGHARVRRRPKDAARCQEHGQRERRGLADRAR